MERNKWEEEFKSKLNQREMTPTPHAWERLDALLNEADSKSQPEMTRESNEEKPVRRLTWMYVAAVIAAFLLLSTLFLLQGSQKNQVQTNEVVIENTPKTEPADRKGIVPSNNVNPAQQTQVAETTPAPKLQKEQPGSAHKMTVVAQQIRPEQNPVVQQEVKKGEPDRFEGPKTDDKKGDNLINDKTNEQLASIDSKMQNPKNVKVDARSLLSQVDGELDMTFREKTIKSLSRKYQNVKVALANRNNQE